VAKNRLHLDIEVANHPAEVERVRANGATVIAQLDTWTVLQDPEGNEFCLTDPHRGNARARRDRWPFAEEPVRAAQVDRLTVRQYG
jgi:hypothetical protein